MRDSKVFAFLFLFFVLWPQGVLGKSCAIDLPGLTPSDLGNPRLFTLQQIRKVKAEVESCRRYVASQVSRLESRYGALGDVLRSLAQMEDVGSISSQVSALKKRRSEVLQNAVKQLSSQRVTMIYAVVVDLPLSYVSQMKGIARALLLNRAAYEGKTLRERYDDRGIFGDFYARANILKDIYENRQFYYGRVQLVYAALVRVYPFAQGRLQRSYNVKNVVADLTDASQVGKLVAFLREVVNPDLADTIVSDMMDAVSLWKGRVEEENRRAFSSINDVVSNLEKLLSDLDARISLLVQELTQKRKRLKALYKKIGFSCQKALPEDCMEEAKGVVSSQRRAIASKVKAIVSKRLESAILEVGSLQELSGVIATWFAKVRARYAKGVPVVDGSRVVLKPSVVYAYPYRDEKGTLKCLVVVGFRAE